MNAASQLTRLFPIVALLLAALGLAACGDGTNEFPADGDLCANIDCGNGICYEQNGRANCDCEDGFTADGLNCVADPCNPDPCAYGFCRVVGGEAVCSCDEGYSGPLCSQCASGYMPRGNVCVPGDPCEDDPCVFGVCSMIAGEVSCTCHSGYAGDLCEVCAEGYHTENLRCMPDNPCSPNPCIHGACNIEENSSVCACEAGYSGVVCDECAEGYVKDGLLCVTDVPVDDPCDPNPCLDNGDAHRNQCVNVGGDALCSCDSDYTLKDDVCISDDDPELNPCNPNPCLDNGDANRNQCVRDGDGFSCLCDEGYLEDSDSGDCVEDVTSVPTRSCGVTLQFRSNSNGPIYVRGEHNGWGLSDQMEKADGVWSITIADLDPGDYAYKLFDNSSNSWFIDPNNPYTKYNAGEQNSRLRVPDCDRPLLVLDGDPTVGSDSIQFTVSAYYGRQRAALDAATAVVTRNGHVYAGASFDASTGVFTIDDDGLAPGKYSYRVHIADAQGNAARQVFVPVWVEQEAFDWRDGVMYFVMTDRFVDGNAANNAPVSDGQLDYKANWQGGDFAGIAQKIDDGYFSDMGVNTIWISSPIMNTQGAFWGSDGHKYTGYHSYWPIATGWTDDNHLPGVQPIDPHFGDLEDFKDLVQTAHENGIRVIADFVANHVHTDSPLWDAHEDDSTPWFHFINGNAYVCGWDKPIECWFADYLPDLEYKNLEVMKTVMDHAVWLVQETNIDGFRLDAVKHMILDFSLTVRARIEEEVDTVSDSRFYMVGETFTGEDGFGAISYYVGPDMLDGQFDFPQFWKALKTLVRYESNLYELKNFTEANVGAYGESAVMSTFLGNHDVARVLSHAAGDIADMWGNGSKEQGWSNPPSAPSSEWPYKRLQLAWTYLFTQQGIPLIYYGDEVGLPGAGDPDNRRMMKFGQDLNAYQRATLTHVQKLGAVRNAHAALRRGNLQTRLIENEIWAYTMTQGNDAALVVLNRGNSRTVSLNVSGSFDNGQTLKDAVSGATVAVSGGSANVTIGGGASAVFVVQ